MIRRRFCSAESAVRLCRSRDEKADHPLATATAPWLRGQPGAASVCELGRRRFTRQGFGARFFGDVRSWGTGTTTSRNIGTGAKVVPR